jgi:uncharacterized lipoprotein YmbA
MSRCDHDVFWTFWRPVVAGVGFIVLTSCAAPPVTMYRLGMPAPLQTVIPLAPQPVVIAIDRVSLPDDIDTEDIFVRHGSALQRSSTGRWASRLSLGATALLTELLAQSRPDALITDEPQTTTPSGRVVINVSRLDLSAGQNAEAGTAVLEADWKVIPGNPAAATLRDRTQITEIGPVGSDAAVVALTTSVLTRLAAAIDITRLR